MAHGVMCCQLDFSLSVVSINNTQSILDHYTTTTTIIRRKDREPQQHSFSTELQTIDPVD